jgi:hypothetical protein
MARSQYSLNNYVGGASPAALNANINDSITTIILSGTNSSWDTLGATGGFFLSLNYGTSTEEKIWVPSGTYNWSSPPVTLTNVSRGVDNTSPQNLSVGYPVVPILTATDLQEANTLVTKILGSGNLTTTSGMAILSTGAGITYGNVASSGGSGGSIASLTGAGLTTTPGLLVQSGGLTIQDDLSDSVFITTSGFIVITAGQGIDLQDDSGGSISLAAIGGGDVVMVTDSGTLVFDNSGNFNYTGSSAYITTVNGGLSEGIILTAGSGFISIGTPNREAISISGFFVGISTLDGGASIWLDGILSNDSIFMLASGAIGFTSNAAFAVDSYGGVNLYNYGGGGTGVQIVDQNSIYGVQIATSSGGIGLNSWNGGNYSHVLISGGFTQIGGVAGSTTTTNSGVFFPIQAITTNAPPYVKGGMYFDTTLNKLRIGGATAWETITSV